MGMTSAARCAHAHARVQRRRPGRCPRSGSTSMLRALRPGHPARDPAPVPQLPPAMLAAAGARLGELRRAGARRVGRCATPTSRRASAPSYARALRGGELARAPGRRPLAVARPPGRGRARRRLPERRVSAHPDGHCPRASPAQARARAIRPAAGACAGRRRGRSRRCSALVYVILAPQSPDLAAASYRSELFAQRRLHAVGQQLVRRPPPARLLAARARRSARCSARQLLAALSMTPRRRCSARARRGRFPPRAARAACVCGSRSAPAIALLSSRVPVRPRPRDRPRRRSCGARSAGAGAAALALAAARAAREPGRRCVPGARRRSPGRVAIPGRRVGALRRARRAAALAPIARAERSPSRKAARSRSSPRPSSRRSAAVLAIGLRAAARAARAAHRRGALRARADRRVRGADRGRRQRRPPRRAARRPARRVRARSERRRRWRRIARPAARARAAALLAGERPARRLRAPSAEPGRRRRPTTARCSPSCGRSASATARGRRGSRSCRPSEHWEARWVAPAAMIARGWERQLDLYRNGALLRRPAPLTAAQLRAPGSTSRRSPTSRCRTRRWTTRARPRRGS